MSAPKLFFILVLCSSFSFMATSNCGDQKCGSAYLTPEIRFPFRVIDRQPEICGYPGFDVHCAGKNRTLLELPNSVFLEIKYLHHKYQEIDLSDPDGCLIKKLLSRNLLDNSPFQAKSYQEFAIFNCSGWYKASTYNGTLDFDLHKIDCLSGSNYTVYAVNALWAVSLLSSSCQWAANISVPDNRGLRLSPPENYETITLYWDEPRCGQCEKLNRWCRVTDDSVPEIQCTSEFYSSGESAVNAIILSLGIGLPLLVVVVGCWGCYVSSRHRRQRNESATEMSTGIDQSILDSYPRVVIGESGRMIRPDDTTCPICLLEYQINQVLEILPHCQHRFHAACIDQWLVLNGTCPICRVPPPS